MKYLFVMPHLDDEMICCGGFLKKLFDKNKEFLNAVSNSNASSIEQINCIGDIGCHDPYIGFNFLDNSDNSNNLKNQNFYHRHTFTNIDVNVFNEVRIITLCKGRDMENSKSRIKVFADLMNELNFDYFVYNYFDLSLERYNLADIADVILNEIRVFNPQVLITSSEYDLHQDHVIVSKACKIAAREVVPEFYEAFNPYTKILKEHYFDTSILIKNELKYKILSCKKYSTEKIKTKRFTQFEYLKTIWRSMD